MQAPAHVWFNLLLGPLRRHLPAASFLDTCAGFTEVATPEFPPTCCLTVCISPHCVVVRNARSKGSPNSDV